MIVKNLIYIIAFLAGLFLLSNIWLRWYTDHGTSYELPDYEGYDVNAAKHDAKKRGFKVNVLDSVFIVGEPGGVILSQNPTSGSKVKKNRKIYVTTTKYTPETVNVNSLPNLYGKQYDRANKALLQGYEIGTKIVGYRYDRGPANHILAVIYEGDTIIDGKRRLEQVAIKKGSTLEMILSKPTGARLRMVDVLCQDYLAAQFQIRAFQLHVETEISDDLTDLNTAFVVNQVPEPNTIVYSGDTILLTLSREKPDRCND